MSDLSIALQPVVEFSTRRGSVFDDPGDEKSWRISQRGKGLTVHFAGREPSWYARAVRPLEGADSVLDLGSGLGLALEALREQGARRVVGVDRWLTFAERATPETPMVLHDLSLPMPFIESGSFEGVFSHYVIEYMAPIGMRQVLREAHRILRPGGRLLVYVAGVGLGGSDVARTVPCSPAALRTILLEAGFDDFDIAAPDDGRNSVVEARRSSDDTSPAPAPAGEVSTPLHGDTQLSAAFASEADRVACELSGPGRTLTLSLDLPPDVAGAGRVAACARFIRLHPSGSELRIWIWRGVTPVLSECYRLEFVPTELRLHCPGEVEHCSVWAPVEVQLEPPGDAYARAADLPEAAELGEIQRGAEGRKVVVERARERSVNASRVLGDGRNRFLVRRGRDAPVGVLDREWAAGKAHGIVLSAAELDGEARRDLLLWAGWQGAPVFVEGESWERIVSAVSARLAELSAPLVLVDPALDGEYRVGALPPSLFELVRSLPGAHILFAESSRGALRADDLVALRGRLLHGGASGPDAAGMLEADETLRYLTERVMLLQLRRLRPFDWAEVGRRPALA